MVKLNGWPNTFDERAKALDASVDDLVVVRPKPIGDKNKHESIESVTTYNLYPQRGAFVKPSWVKPFVFSIHVLQAVLLLIYLQFKQERPSVIHAFDYALGGFAGAVVSQLFSVPLIVSVRGLKEPIYNEMIEEEGTYRARIKYQILTTMTRFVLVRANHIVTKSPYQVKFVRERFGIDPGFTTLPTGVDFDTFDPEAVTKENALRDLLSSEGHDIESNDRIILFLGKLVQEKGPDTVLELLDQSSSEVSEDIVFVFIGEFRSESFERQFRELQKEVPHKTILYPNRVPFEDVPDILFDADGVILLSKSGTEGAPRVLQEACAMETSIIASEVDGIKGAFAGLPGCHLIGRTDHIAFANAVNNAVEESVSRARFAEQFDMYENYSQYADIYRQLSD
ncbi:glycosyltransferase family 4 protein [Halorubrum ruber]|uniref:Glycosyltransferase family 4 protein n=1 Tax=Halorubrum ruber TaxID=2982524 RepID=A0A8T8LLE0_9EURY|nr:glycosyltransferase family 4 protein [Halorubrum ruber]QUO47726.1 glycosyltransferase family 4 protein [Halorubrum ruber]